MNTSATSTPRSWDIFCRVVDNFGDAAVCWRLAHQLAAEQGGRVRLWLDDLTVLHRLHPEFDPDREQQSIDGVELRHWHATVDFSRNTLHSVLTEPPDIVVEGFGCGLPEAYAQMLAQRSPRTLWITLEYLSAEPWVAEHHGLPSPHPRLPLQRYFFFPGFTSQTGGLLKEAGLDSRCEQLGADPAARAVFWRGLGFAPPAANARVVSLFGYENRGVRDLLDAWAGGSRPVVAAIAAGRLRPQVEQFFGVASNTLPLNGVLRRGALEARLLPFLPQPDYDELLWSCDLNFVRGEDSFVRAQWAARPLVWHIYPQAAQAHWVKLEAFLDAYCVGLSAEGSAALRALWHDWNAVTGAKGQTVPARVSAAWQALDPHWDSLAAHARTWVKTLENAGNLAEKLARFCEDRLKSRPF